MKNSIPPLCPSRASSPTTLPAVRKPSYSLFGSLTAMAASLVLIGSQHEADAQSDDFNDENDSPPTVAGFRYDSVSTLFGIPAQDTWSFPGGNKYRLQAAPALGSNPGQ